MHNIYLTIQERMNNHFDLIIVGAGPAGLRCAEILTGSDLRILLLEKNQVIGPKVCAGGITKKSMELMSIPDHLIEFGIKASMIRSAKNYHQGELAEPAVYMIDRKEFGQWQAGKLKNSNIEIKTGTLVTEIEDNKLKTNKEEVFFFKHLVGADGANSIVRRHLKLPVKKRLVTLQYKIPGTYPKRVELILNSGFFHSGYAWVFPHKNYFSVGCCVDPRIFHIQKLKTGFQKWLEQNNFDLSEAKYESSPVSYDYRGFAFGNIFLAGEAAGLASGLTGEGIYQALVSGEEIAKMILDKDYVSTAMKEIIKYNRVQFRILQLFRLAGPFRDFLYNMIIRLFKSWNFNKKVIDGYS